MKKNYTVGAALFWLPSFVCSLVTSAYWSSVYERDCGGEGRGDLVSKIKLSVVSTVSSRVVSSMSESSFTNIVLYF